MKKIVSLAMMLCVSLCAAVSAQDTRMTPGIYGGKNVRSNTPANNDRGDTAKKDGTCEDGTCESGTCAGEECPLMATAMESLPKMVFKVGDEETCCHMTATRMSHEMHEKIVYLVGTKKFGDSHDAFESLVRQTELYVKRFVTPKVCTESGATTLAGETCECSESASKMTELVSAATKGLKMTYRVGAKEFDKYHAARRFAKKTHQKGTYVVAGEKFEEELEARLALAHKKFRSAVAAVQSAKTGQPATAAAQSAPKTEQNSGQSAEGTGLAAKDG